jgi:hypothetical protein
MKRKKLSSKLKLNKKTVSNLNGSDMNGVHGGGTYIYCGPTGRTECYTDCVTGCPQCPSEYCTPNTLDENTCAVSCDLFVCSEVYTCTC